MHQPPADGHPQQQTFSPFIRSILHHLWPTKANISCGKSIKAKKVPTAKLTESKTDAALGLAQNHCHKYPILNKMPS